MSVGNIYESPTGKRVAWDVQIVNLFDEPDTFKSGSRDIRFTIPGSAIHIARVDRQCRLYLGTGRRHFVGTLNPGQRRSIELPSEIEEFHVEWDGTTNPFLANLESTIQPILELWVATDVIFYAEAFDPGPRLSFFFQPLTPGTNDTDFRIDELPSQSPIVVAIPALASACPNTTGYTPAGNSDCHNPADTFLAATHIYTEWGALYSNPVSGVSENIVRGSARALTNTYSCVFRKAARPYVPSNSFAAAGRSILASLWNPAQPRNFRLRKADVFMYSLSAAADCVFELVRITTIPTGGVNRTATIGKHSGYQGASFAECRTSPSGGGTESGEVFSILPANYGTTGAVSTVNPPSAFVRQSLYDDSYPDAVHPIDCRNDFNEGIAIIIDVDVAVTVRAYAQMTWTES